MVRFLGVDYGTKRIGIAVSDEGGMLAFPRMIVLNDKSVFEKIGIIIKKEKINEIVIGESTNLSGKQNILSGKIEVFVLKLKEMFKLPVHSQKEFFTSIEARRFPKNKKYSNQTQAHSRRKKEAVEHVDASAAALILQRYLDKINKLND